MQNFACCDSSDLAGGPPPQKTPIVFHCFFQGIPLRKTAPKEHPLSPLRRYSAVAATEKMWENRCCGCWNQEEKHLLGSSVFFLFRVSLLFFGWRTYLDTFLPPSRCSLCHRGRFFWAPRVDIFKKNQERFSWDFRDFFWAR